MNPLTTRRRPWSPIPLDQAIEAGTTSTARRSDVMTVARPFGRSTTSSESADKVSIAPPGRYSPGPDPVGPTTRRNLPVESKSVAGCCPENTHSRPLPSILTPEGRFVRSAAFKSIDRRPMSTLHVEQESASGTGAAVCAGWRSAADTDAIEIANSAAIAPEQQHMYVGFGIVGSGMRTSRPSYKGR